MFISAAAILLAIVLVWVIIGIDRRTPAHAGPAPRPTTAGWSAAAFGVLGLIALVVPLVASRVRASSDGGEGTVAHPLLPLASIAFSLVGVALGGYAFRRHDRHWPTWVGLAAGGLTVGFWLFFVVGEML